MQAQAERNRLFKVAAVVIAAAALAAGSFAQELPSKIRGYKTHRADLKVTGEEGTNGLSHLQVLLSDPRPVGIGITGAEIEFGAEIAAPAFSGRIDRVTFQNVTVNGIEVTVADYEHSFKFRKGERIVLKAPARLTVPVSGMVRAAYGELVDQKEWWSVTGTALVFGRYRRFGMSFKRVVPVKIDIRVPNPLPRLASLPGQ